MKAVGRTTTAWQRPSHGCAIALIGACLSLISACASLPRVDQLIHSPMLYRITPRIATAHGLLTPEQSEAILKRLGREAGETDVLQRHIALEEDIASSPLVAGNRVTLLEDGPATYRVIFSAIHGAKDHINLETYIIEDDEIGNELADLLIEKQAAGVQVNLIYDGVGSIGTPRPFFQRLEDSGVAVLEFNPVDPLKARKAWSLNHRDHRKLLIVDGAIAFTGGINVSAVYSHGSLSAPELDQKDRNVRIPWRDTHAQVEGPVVAEFQKVFLATWKIQNGAPLAPRGYFPPLEPEGKELVRVIASTPDSPLNLIYVTLISAITHAENSVHLTNAYFIPDPQMLETFEAAAGRGVDVTLILPSQSDFWPALAAGRSHYEELLKAGVKIYEHRDALLHAKTVVIDGVWSTIGSTNLDWRSFLYNSELNAVILGREFGDRMEAMFSRDLAASVRIDPERWRRRPFGERFKEWIARLWERWL